MRDRNAELFQKLGTLDHDKIMQARNMDELHESLSIILHKVNNMDEYHSIMSSDAKISDVKVSYTLMSSVVVAYRSRHQLLCFMHGMTRLFLLLRYLLRR